MIENIFFQNTAAMPFDFRFQISAGYSNQQNVDNLIVQIDATVTDNIRTAYSWDIGNLYLTYEDDLSPQDFGTIYSIIVQNDPTSNPIEVVPFTYANFGIIKADVNGTTITYLGSRDNEIHISKDMQNKYSGIREALDNETAENLVFIVHPGTYNENNPLVLRNGCVLKSEGIFENTVIVANNPASNLINLGNKCLVKGLTFQGATNARGVYFDASASGGAGYVSSVQECSIRNCNIAVEADGKNGGGISDMLFCEKLKIVPLNQNVSKGLYAHSKGQIVSIVLSIMGIPGSFTVLEGVNASDAGTKISVSLNSIWFTNKALVVNNGGELEINLVTASNNMIDLEVGSSGTTSILNASGLGIKNSVTYDINILPSAAVLQIHSGAIDDTKINNPNKLTLNAVYHLVRYGKYFQSLTGNVLLGSSREPSKLFAGEGHYDVDRVYVLSNSNLEVGTFVDNTEGALSDEAPPFNLFQDSAVGNCAYIGRQLNLVGRKIDVSTSAAAGLADLIWEYWNGSAWVAFNVFIYKSAAPYYSPTGSWLSEVGSYHINFGLTSSDPQAVKVINGKSASWVRIRVVNALGGVPVLQTLKPHPNSTVIENDGFIRHYGDSRSVKKISVEYTDNYPAFDPGNQALFKSKVVYANIIKNNYAPSVSNSVSFVVAMPRNVDSSFPLKLVFSCTGSSGAGNVFWRIRYAPASSGTALYRTSQDAPNNAADELSITLVTTISTPDVSNIVSVKLPINAFPTNLSGVDQTTLWMVIERDGTDPLDTYGGSANIYDVSLWSVTWCDGNHLLGF